MAEDDDAAAGSGRPAPSEPHPIDAHVGRRLRQRRNELGLSQEQLAEMLSMTFQQIQKYEKASNRISASRLWELAQALGVGVGYFFDDAAQSLHEEMASYQADAGSIREQAEISRAHARIIDPRVRRKLIELARAISSGQTPADF